MQEALEVEIALEGNDGFVYWRAFNDCYVAVSCEGLTGAIHDASMRDVDAIATNPNLLYSK